MDDPTEMNIEGTFFSPAQMERLRQEFMRGCWFWSDNDLALMYRDQTPFPHLTKVQQR
jgi:hypothetical protein